MQNDMKSFGLTRNDANCEILEKLGSEAKVYYNPQNSINLDNGR